MYGLGREAERKMAKHLSELDMYVSSHMITGLARAATAPVALVKT